MPRLREPWGAKGELMPAEIATCKSCGARIRWIQYRGKGHPVNEKPKKLFYNFPVEPGNEWHLADCYESHFATCPDAEDWRKT